MAVLEIIKALLDNAWAFFQIEYPGTGMSFGTIAIGVIMVGFSMSLLALSLGVSISAKSFAMGIGGNNKDIKVSKNRRGDTK